MIVWWCKLQSSGYSLDVSKLPKRCVLCALALSWWKMTPFLLISSRRCFWLVCCSFISSNLPRSARWVRAYSPFGQLPFSIHFSSPEIIRFKNDSISLRFSNISQIRAESGSGTFFIHSSCRVHSDTQTYSFSLRIQPFPKGLKLFVYWCLASWWPQQHSPVLLHRLQDFINFSTDCRPERGRRRNFQNENARAIYVLLLNKAIFDMIFHFQTTISHDWDPSQAKTELQIHFQTWLDSAIHWAMLR